MAGFVAKIVAKKILGETLENRFGQEDPYFEQLPATRLDGRPNGKFKKVRKALPPGLSEQDGKVLTKVKRRAYRLDQSLFTCCGIRFGWSSVIGIIPFVGDVLDAFMAMMVVNTAKKIEGGLPATVLSKMYMNVILDFLVGLVPFVGDVGDAVFKANTRNAVVLEAFLRDKGQKGLRASGLPVPTSDPSDPDEFDRFQSQSPPEYTAYEPRQQSAMNPAPPQAGYRGQTPGVGSSSASSASTPARPAQAPVRKEQPSGRGGGFFGFGRSKKTPAADVEAGLGS